MYWAFDIETYDWDQFVLAAAVAEDGTVKEFRDPDQVIDWYRSTSPSDVVLAHNGGRFDFLWLLKVCGRQFKWSANLAGSAIVSMRSKGHARLVDTFRTFPMSLEDWTEQKTQWDHHETHPQMSSKKYHALMAYCVNDCSILLSTYHRDMARLEKMGMDVRNSRGEYRATLGAISWATACRFWPQQRPEDWRDYAWREYRWGRRAYFGGRTECFRVDAKAGHRHDIHSAYPWSLTKTVPTGVPRWLDGVEASRFYPGVGVYQATVTMKPHRFAPLAHRSEKTSALLWSTGTIAGCWTHVDLLRAEERGARIESFSGAMVYPAEQPVYREYMQWLFEQRHRAAREKDYRWASLLKWYLNSLSGKLAQHAERHTLIVNPEPGELVGGETPLGMGMSCYVRKSTGVIPESARPVQAAVLTSRVRGVLLSRLREDAVYSDTDSVYSLQKLPCSDRLGDFGYEGPMWDWHCLGPKVYTYTGEHGSKAKAKGIPRARPEDVLHMIEQVALPVSDRRPVRKDGGVYTVRAAAARGDLFKKCMIARAPRNDARVAGTRWIQSDGTTLSLHYDDDYRWLGVDTPARDILRRL